MIVCVVENYGKSVFTVNVIDTCLAVTALQREYVAAITAARKNKGEERGKGQTNAECSLLHEEDDEISRLCVILPQRVEACVILNVIRTSSKDETTQESA